MFAPLHARTGTGGGVPKHADLYITTAGEISFATMIKKRSNVKIRIAAFEQLCDYTGSAYPGQMRKHVVELEVAHRQAVLFPIFLACKHIGQFDIVTTKLTQLPNREWRDKTRTNKIALEKLRNPFRVFFISLFAFDGFHVFRVSQANFYPGSFQSIKIGIQYFPADSIQTSKQLKDLSHAASSRNPF